MSTSCHFHWMADGARYEAMSFPSHPDNSSLDLLLLQWLEDSFSSQEDSFQDRYVLIFLYALSVSLSVVGNVITIIIISQSLGRRSHIALYQLNLSVADLFMSLFCVPFTFAQAHVGYWAVGSLLCPLVLFLQLCFVIVSAYTNVAIGVDRFSGVIFPLKWKPTSNQRKAIVFGVWALSAALALPEVVVGRSLPQDMGNTTLQLCNEYWSGQEEREIYTLVVFMLVLLIPLVTLTITYSCVVFTLWIRETPGNADLRRDRKRLASKKKVTRMLIIVVAMFGVCWVPLHLFNLILDFRPDLVYTSSEQSLQGVFFACHWLAMSHAFVNPIIYVAADEDFRNKVFKLLTCQNQICVRQRAMSFLTTGTRKSALSFSSFRKRRRRRGSYDTQHKRKTKEQLMLRRRSSSPAALNKVSVTRTLSEHGAVSLNSTSTLSSVVVLELQLVSQTAAVYLPGLEEASQGDGGRDVSSQPQLEREGLLLEQV